ncbi:hypothetical protein, variant, partial [Sphaeroforma arctica JP610]
CWQTFPTATDLHGHVQYVHVSAPVQTCPGKSLRLQSRSPTHPAHPVPAPSKDNISSAEEDPLHPIKDTPHSSPQAATVEDLQDLQWPHADLLDPSQDTIDPSAQANPSASPSRRFLSTHNSAKNVRSHLDSLVRRASSPEPETRYSKMNRIRLGGDTGMKSGTRIRASVDGVDLCGDGAGAAEGGVMREALPNKEDVGRRKPQELYDHRVLGQGLTSTAACTESHTDGAKGPLVPGDMASTTPRSNQPETARPSMQSAHSDMAAMQEATALCGGDGDVSMAYESDASETHPDCNGYEDGQRQAQRDGGDGTQGDKQHTQTQVPNSGATDQSHATGYTQTHSTNPTSTDPHTDTTTPNTTTTITTSLQSAEYASFHATLAEPNAMDVDDHVVCTNDAIHMTSPVTRASYMRNAVEISPNSSEAISALASLADIAGMHDQRAQQQRERAHTQWEQHKMSSTGKYRTGLSLRGQSRIHTTKMHLSVHAAGWDKGKADGDTVSLHSVGAVPSAPPVAVHLNDYSPTGMSLNHRSTSPNVLKHDHTPHSDTHDYPYTHSRAHRYPDTHEHDYVDTSIALMRTPHPAKHAKEVLSAYPDAQGPLEVQDKTDIGLLTHPYTEPHPHTLTYPNAHTYTRGKTRAWKAIEPSTRTHTRAHAHTHTHTFSSNSSPPALHFTGARRAYRKKGTRSMSESYASSMEAPAALRFIDYTRGADRRKSTTESSEVKGGSGSELGGGDMRDDVDMLVRTYSTGSPTTKLEHIKSFDSLSSCSTMLSKTRSLGDPPLCKRKSRGSGKKLRSTRFGRTSAPSFIDTTYTLDQRLKPWVEESGLNIPSGLYEFCTGLSVNLSLPPLPNILPTFIPSVMRAHLSSSAKSNFDASSDEIGYFETDGRSSDQTPGPL